MWHIEIDSLTVLFIKWDQNEEKNVTGSFSAHWISIEPIWELIFNISYWIWLWYIKIDRFHGQSIKWGQKWKKLYELTFSSGEPFWELIFKFHIKYWLWRIKIYRFHGLSIKWGQKWKNSYELTFGSAERLWKLV